MVATAVAANPDTNADNSSPCNVKGESYAAPYAGLTSYSQTETGCTNSPYGAILEAYFWDGVWWRMDLTHPTKARYTRTLYSAATEGWHRNYFPYSPYQRFTYTYAAP